MQHHRDKLDTLTLYIFYVKYMFTDRIRSTTGDYVFTGVCLLTWGGGHTLSPSHNISIPQYPDRGYPRPRSQTGGDPSWVTPIGPGQDGVHPSSIWPGQDGVAPSGQGWGTPHLARSGWATPPPLSCQVRMGSPPWPGRGTPSPRIGQQFEYFTHHGRYASCGFPQEDFLFTCYLCQLKSHCTV